MRDRLIVRGAVAGFLMFTAGCAGDIAGSNRTMTQDAGVKPSAGTSLSDRLGKKEAITAVVDDFAGRVANHGRITASSTMPISLA